MTNNTWKLVERGTSKKVIGNKWVYKVKYNPNGTVSRYKTRMIAKEYHQKEGIDYTDTFSPMAKSLIVKIILSLAVTYGCDIKQVNVNYDFLNGELSETVYMSQPDGFQNKKKPNYVCKLKKVFNGWAWYKKLKEVLLSLRMQSQILPCSIGSMKKFNLATHLCWWYTTQWKWWHDDRSYDKKIEREFCIQGVGDLNYFLGIAIKRDCGRMHLCQAKYIQDVLNKLTWLIVNEVPHQWAHVWGIVKMLKKMKDEEHLKAKHCIWEHNWSTSMCNNNEAWYSRQC